MIVYKITNKKRIEKLSKKIRCIETNIEYKSIREAGRMLNLSAPDIGRVIKGIRNHVGGLTFAVVGI